MNPIQFLHYIATRNTMLSAYIPDYVPDYVTAYTLTPPKTTSKPNSQRIPGEYKMKHATAYRSFGPFPGQMQTAVPLPDLCHMDIPFDQNEERYTDMGGRHYMLTDHTAENKMRTLPATRDMTKLKLFLCMEYKDPKTNETWLKSAYLNTETQTVSLYTSTNRKDKLKRPIATHTHGWFVGQYYMAAPLAFWRALKNRLIH